MINILTDYQYILQILSEGSSQSKKLLGILDEELSLPNIKFPTMGGIIFWTDIVSYGGWRLQQNDITHHARILDADDVRIAWGTINGMYKALDRLVLASQRYESLQGTSEERLNSMEELKSLKELLDIGAITTEEFNDKKAEIMKRI